MDGVSTNDTATRRIHIDTGRCSGHGRCYTLAPDVFDPDEEGFPVLLTETVAADPQLLRDVQTAIDACPERAISMESEE